MVADALAISGALAVVAGVALVSIPAALVVLGVLAMVAAWRLS
jgi:hypothetical protein